MTRPNRALFVVVVLVSVAALATPATAVSATANHTPNATHAGENVTASFVLTDLYTDAPTAWRLHTTTQLENATWTVTTYGLDRSTLATRSSANQSLELPVRAARNVSRVGVTVTGTAPPVRNFTYPSPERYRVVSLARSQGRGSPRVIRNWGASHYTRRSRSARRTLDASHAAIRNNGSDDDLEERFGFAATAYRAGEFDLATAIAANAKHDAEQSHYPIGLVSGLFLGGIVVALGTAGIRSYRTRDRDDRWSDR